jgi:hypothetical protein
MPQSKQVVFLLILLLLFQSLLSYSSEVQTAVAQAAPDFYVGVDVAFENLTATKQLIDNVSAYTNFFVIGCSGDYNSTRLTDISQYAYSKGLHFLVYTDVPNYPSQQWLENAKRLYRDKFMGIYAYDEPGGKQLDRSDFRSIKLASNYSEAAQEYVHSINWLLRSDTKFSITNYFALPNQFPLFTSDYALYWYDYQAGYDTVFAQLGFNFTRQLTISLVRGAATCFEKDWGVIMCWTYNNQPPYIEGGPELYEDMVLAYLNGAKYIVIFDSNQGYTESILRQEHFDAMEQFWEYAKKNPRDASAVGERTAYVLPEDFGYGFNGVNGKMWGVWNSDKLVVDVYTQLNETLKQYGRNLDIIYPNGSKPIELIGYNKIINWTGTVLVDAPIHLPSPSPLAPPNKSPFFIYTIVTVVVVLLAVTALLPILKSKKPIFRFK